MKSRILLFALSALAFASAASAQTLGGLTLKDATSTTQNECVYNDGTRLYPCHLNFGWTGSAAKAWTMDASGYGGVNVFSSALPTGAATASGVAQIAANTKPVSSFSTVTVGSTVTPGLGIAAVCTAAGNVVLAASDTSQITVPVSVGFNQFGFAVAKVVSQTATCTFTTLN